MAAGAGDRCGCGGGSIGSVSGGIPPETREYFNKVGEHFNKVVEPVTKIALYSIGQFAMHLLAYGLLIGVLGTGIAAAGGAFGNIDTIYRVLAGGGALVICGAGGFFTKFILPNISDNLNLKIEKQQAKLDEALSKKADHEPKSEDDGLAYVQGTNGIEAGSKVR